MSDLFWPGDDRAGELMSPAAFLAAMVQVEQAWLDALSEAGIAPATAPLAGLVTPFDIEDLARASEQSGSPVVPLVELLRQRAGGEVARWVHRGLTSQDVVDTALMLATRAVLDSVRTDLHLQMGSLIDHARRHRDSVMVGRTLTQHAVPVTFGLKASVWLTGVLDAAEVLDRIRLPIQLGGAAGTLAAVTELSRRVDSERPEDVVRGLVTTTADRLGLACHRPWHTTRSAVTAIGDALVGCSDAWGRIATDVATLSRPEIAELAEPLAPGRGGSSTMPHKQNPVLSVLIRRTAISNPGLAAVLHTASALAGDERPDGAWHAEWATLRVLCRHTAVAGSQTTELLCGLRVDADRMSATATAAQDDLLAEHASLVPRMHSQVEPRDYLGVAAGLVDDVLQRASGYLAATR